MQRQIMKSQKFKELFSLFFIIFIDTFCWFIFAPILLKLYLPGAAAILPDYTPMPTRYFLYGLTMSLPPLAFIIVSPFVGMASDLFGRKKVLLTCLSISFFSFVLPIYGITKNLFLWIFLGRLIGGASTASQPVAQAAVADCAESTKDKALYLSFIALAMTLGLLLGPLMGGYLSNPQTVRWFSVKTPLYIGAVLTVINIFLLIYGYRPVRTKRYNYHNPLFLSLSLFKQLLKPRLLLLLVIFFMIEFSWSLYYQSIYLILPSLLQFTTEQVATFTAYAGICMCAGLSLIYPLLIRYFSTERIAIVSLIGMTLGFLGCQIISAYFLILTVTLVSIFTGIGYVSLLALLSDCLDKRNQGWILGVGGTTLALAWFITGFLSGVLVNIEMVLPIQIALIAISVASLIGFKLLEWK